MEQQIQELDKLFKSYNYSVSSESSEKVRIYTLRYGMYHAAEIILLDDGFDPSSVKTEYSELGYATEIKKLSNIIDIEEYLFEGFFIKTPLGNELKSRYNQFVDKQIKNLPQGSAYEYITSSFDLFHQNEHGSLIEGKTYSATGENVLIDKLNTLMAETPGALFIVLEAAAGFGKTCTAYEVLNTFSAENNKKLPFFTELSRNREARIFKHILLKEIDEQFPNGIKQNIVIDQITKGRIPLIIDGFDELITRESSKEEVESMLTTIVELLKGSAKIIITSRKTAIFNSDEFLESVHKAENEFSLARIEIKEPTIENWLSQERIDILESHNFPLEQVANPVLLSYLRNININRLNEYVQLTSSESLIDKYIDYLLKREQVRQNIKLSVDEQLRVFRKLVIFMTEYNITAESKEIIKDFIREYNIEILQRALKDYISEERPSMEDLVETLSNHVFLDRKPNGDIGFVNEFILGLLVGENMILGEYEDYLLNNSIVLPEDFAQKSLQSFKIQSKDRQFLLWKKFNSFNFDYDASFYFNLDYNYIGTFKRSFDGLFIENVAIEDVIFTKEYTFSGCTFSNVKLVNCQFDLQSFNNTNFYNCEFYGCSASIDKNLKFVDFAFYACNSDNKFIENVEACFEDNNIYREESNTRAELSKEMVLSHFFGIGNRKPRARKISFLREILSAYTSKEVNSMLSTLKNEGFLLFKDDLGFISKSGINYFNQNKSNL